MKRLINDAKIETMGDVDGGWKEFDVRKPGSQAENEEVKDEALNS
jgi:hypothetical protein